MRPAYQRTGLEAGGVRDVRDHGAFALLSRPRDAGGIAWEAFAMGMEHSEGPEFLQWLSGLGPVIETHASWVALTGDQAIKFKKPVNFGFLDFSSRQKREAFCERELELNRRLAPSVYRAVWPLYRGPGGYVLGERASRGPGGAALELVDHAVVMRRLREQDRADVLLAEGRLDAAHLSRLAAKIASFHEKLQRDQEGARYGTAEVVRKNALENFVELEASTSLSAGEWERLQEAQLAFLDRNQELLASRVESGHVKDGHGDLRLEHVYFEGEDVVIVDCIEFSDRFRFADTALDLAFLTMDLRRLGRPDLAEDFLAEVAALAGDYEAYALIDFYESYRATVRGKVAALRARQMASVGPEGAPYEEARAFLKQAQQALTPSERPRLICMGGLMASGKSTLARRIGRALHCPVVDSDGTRKRLCGVDPWTPLTSAPFVGAYTAETTERTYARLLEFARLVLRSGRCLIVDASFQQRRWRRHFAALAEEEGVPLFFVECFAEESVLLERLQRRAEGPSRSDGRVSTLGAFRSAFEPIDADELRRLYRCDTSRGAEQEAGAILRFLADV